MSAAFRSPLSLFPRAGASSSCIIRQRHHRTSHAAARPMPTAAELEEKLKHELKATEVSVVDTSDGCGAKFEVEIISSAFEGQKPLARHRLVNAALKDEMPKLHALSIKKAATPAEAGK